MNAWAIPAGGASTGEYTATWNAATGTLTDSVTSGGAVFATFSGQALAGLASPPVQAALGLPA